MTNLQIFFWFLTGVLVLTAIAVNVVMYMQRCACRKYRLGWDQRIVEEVDGVSYAHTRQSCTE